MEGKKISFGFSKIKAKASPTIQRPKGTKEKEEVVYITSFDRNEKIEVERPPELVIPVKTNYTVADRILAKRQKQEEQTSSEDSTIENDGSETHDAEKLSRTSVPTEAVVSLESLAIQELMQDSQKTMQKSQPTLSIPTKRDLEPDEPADDNVDYDSVPVSEFGYAMLRGMGWAPGQGIGKKQKVVEVVDLTIRPRSLGLGAEFVPDRKTVSKDIKESKEKPRT